VWLVWVASASLHSQAALAADVSAAAASALKVLSVPLPDGATLPATAAPPSAPPEMAHFPASITVQRGESIDAVIRRGLPGLPLRDEFMRQALAKANPRIFPKGTTYPVRPGTVLQMPSVDALRQQMLSQHPQAAVLFQAGPAPSPETPAGTNKRHWVRFP
jgi:Tfp pilus assembly protein FimV